MGDSKQKKDTRRIWVPYGNTKKIAKALNCTPQMVNGALAGRKTSKLAEKIRYVAIKEYNGHFLQSA